MEFHRVGWDDSLSVGDELVDSQHKKLVGLIAAISEYIPDAKDQHVMNEAIEYAGFHFNDEEAYMAKIGYPGLPAHQTEHKRLTTILLGFQKDCEEGRMNMFSFKQFMFRWVLDHIMGADKKIGEFTRSQKSPNK